MPATSRPSMANPAAAAGLVAVGPCRQVVPGGRRCLAGAPPLGLAGVTALPPPGRRPELGGVTALVLVTLLAALAAPHARVLRAASSPASADSRPSACPSSQPPRRPPGRPRGWASPTGPGAGPPATGPRRGLTAGSASWCWPWPPATASASRVCAARHSWFVKGTRRVSNHSVWRGVDIDRVDGRPVSPSNAAVRGAGPLDRPWRAGAQPSEVGSPWAFGGRPWFTDSGHQGHLHVGFAGPTQAGGR